MCEGLLGLTGWVVRVGDDEEGFEAEYTCDQDAGMIVSIVDGSCRMELDLQST